MYLIKLKKGGGKMTTSIHFKSNEELLETTRCFARNLTQCKICMIFWSNDHKLNQDGKKLQIEEILEIELCADDLSRFYISVNQLEENGIRASHGFCKHCIRHMLLKIVKTRQERMGFWPCFGTAVDGNCDQKKCKFYDTCVVNKREVEIWEKRISQLSKIKK